MMIYKMDAEAKANIIYELTAKVFKSWESLERQVERITSSTGIIILQCLPNKLFLHKLKSNRATGELNRTSTPFGHLGEDADC